MLDIVYSEAEVNKLRKAVAEVVFKESHNIKSGKITSISERDLSILFDCYDSLFLGNWFKTHFKGEMQFELSRRMIKSAGMTKCPKNIAQLPPHQIRILIIMGVDLLFKFDRLEGSKLVCGINAEDSLKALQIVFEHELIHALEFVLFHTSNCKGARFKAAAGAIFGHTQSYHQMPTHRDIASEKLDIQIGDKVQFQFEGKSQQGIVSNISKRATVMVESLEGAFVDRMGTRYSKYYVPLTALRK